jgi:hypothetical protein
MYSGQQHVNDIAPGLEDVFLFLHVTARQKLIWETRGQRKVVFSINVSSRSRIYFKKSVTFYYSVKNFMMS